MKSISLTNPENVTELRLGSASDNKLGGKVDLTKFIDLTVFIANSINLTDIIGFEKLSKLETFQANNNLLAPTPIPTLVDCIALKEFDISYQSDGGPTDIAEDWSVPESITKFDISHTDIGGPDDDDGAVKLKILTAFYHVFKDFATNSKAGSEILADNTGGVISVSTNLYAPYADITIADAILALVDKGFTFSANQF